VRDVLSGGLKRKSAHRTNTRVRKTYRRRQVQPRSCHLLSWCFESHDGCTKRNADESRHCSSKGMPSQPDISVRVHVRHVGVQILREKVSIKNTECKEDAPIQQGRTSCRLLPATLAHSCYRTCNHPRSTRRQCSMSGQPSRSSS